MTCIRLLSPLLLIVSLSVADDFPLPFNTEPLPQSSWLAPDQAAEQFTLPPGFRATAFAAEPDVQNPIAMAWDARGRLWIAENYTYADRDQKFQLGLRDRVVVFDNTQTDRFQTRTVFTDDVQMLTGIEVGLGGVWLMCPPKLIFIPDRDRDDVPDSAGEVVLDGFTVAQQNYHNFANGLRFGPDGWLYGRCGGSCPGRIGRPGTSQNKRLALEGGIWRYHPKQQTVEVLTSGTTNPWGHDWNGLGDLFFVNTVNGHLWQGIPGAHFTRPFTLDPNARTFELIDFHADHWHFDTGKSWIMSRAGAANSYGGGHAHSGAMIYQGTRWPQRYQGKLLTLNFHGRRANQERLVRLGGGYVAQHEPDFFIAQDPWFRGMDLSCGPDGNVFVIDWSDTGECHEHTGVHRTSGRIFKISYGQNEQAAKQPIDLQSCSDQQLRSLAMSPEAWSFRQARLELARRRQIGDELTAVSEALRLTFEDPNADSRQLVQSLLALHAAGATNDVFLSAQLAHRDEYVRAWAIRLLTECWPIDDALGPVFADDQLQRAVARASAGLLPKLLLLAENDSSALVRLTLASTLQRLPVSMRADLAIPLVSHAEDAGDHNIPLMLWYGLMAVGDDQRGDLVAVAGACKIPVTLRLISRFLAQQIERHPRPINDLIALAAQSDDDDFRSTVVQGISEGWTGWQKVPRPSTWNGLAAAKNSQPTTELIQQLNVLFGDGHSVDQVTAIALGQTDAGYPMRLTALQTLIQIKPANLKTICQPLLKDARMNVLAARGLSMFDDPEVAKSLISQYRSFRAPERPQIMSILVSRPSFARQMLNAIGDGQIDRDQLSAFQARQIRSFDDQALHRLLSEVWGEVRDSSADQQELIGSLKQQLTTSGLPTADLRSGRSLFAKHCQSCHKLYGQGETVGPDLTGGDRGNLDYLLTNIVDPSAVVDKDFRMTQLLTADGRLITGLVTAETERTISIRTATEALVLDKSSLQSRKLTENSPMPNGLLQTLSSAQIRDLIGYLQHPTQVELDH